MSLQKCSKCGNINDFWDVYRDINFSRFKGGAIIRCRNCGNKSKIWNKNKIGIKNIFYGFLWSLPALILIYLVATLKLNFIIAIFLITIFHFVSLYLIIKLGKYVE